MRWRCGGYGLKPSVVKGLHFDSRYKVGWRRVYPTPRIFNRLELQSGLPRYGEPRTRAS